MHTNVIKRSIRVATIAAVGGAMLAMPVSAFAAGFSTESDGDAKVKLGAGNDQRTERYDFDVKGKQNGGGKGNWAVQVSGTPSSNKNGTAVGKVRCVSGHDLAGKPGNIAVIGVQITDSGTNFYPEDRFLLHYVYDSKGVDQTRTVLAPANATGVTCPVNGDILKGDIAGLGLEKIRKGGDLDVKIND